MNNFLAKLPSTNYMIFSAVSLGAITVLTILVLIALGRPINQSALDSLLKTIAGILTIAAAQFTAKRATYKNAPPNARDVEDKAGA